MSTSLRDHLEDIRARRGRLTPRVVLDEARDPDHPLHSDFEWDDAVAAEAHRLDQARRLIQIVNITITDSKGKPQTLRAYQSVKRDSGHVFEPIEEIALDPICSQIVLMDMRREWKAFQARYGHFAEFVQMVRRDLGDEPQAS